MHSVYNNTVLIHV